MSLPVIGVLEIHIDDDDTSDVSDDKKAINFLSLKETYYTEEIAYYIEEVAYYHEEKDHIYIDFHKKKHIGSSGSTKYR